MNTQIETVEEAAKRILANNIDGLRDVIEDDDLFYFYKGVVECYGEAMAKYQAERMYSEFEVLQLLLRLKQTEKYDNLYDWFEQHKKK